jgi:hypothetical protein
LIRRAFGLHVDNLSGARRRRRQTDIFFCRHLVAARRGALQARTGIERLVRWRCRCGRIVRRRGGRRGGGRRVGRDGEWGVPVVGVHSWWREGERCFRGDLAKPRWAPDVCRRRWWWWRDGSRHNLGVQSMGDETRQRHVYGRRKWSILDVAHTRPKGKLGDKKKEAKRTFMLPRKSGRRKQEREACHGGRAKGRCNQRAGDRVSRAPNDRLAIKGDSGALRLYSSAVATKTRSDNLDARAAGGSRDWAR